MERILIYLAIAACVIGGFAYQDAAKETAVREARTAGREAAISECANSRQVAVNMARAESMATQAALSGIARAQLAAAELAKTEAERLADSFGRQLVKQREAKPLPSPCNITQERAELLNRATGAIP